jgi:dsRNA-specific ribonuclease
MNKYINITDRTNKYININFFREAFKHISIVENEIESYERLEFLGDAVFHLIVTHYIYNRYNEEGSGFLTRIRICIEKSESLIDLTKKLKLNKFIQYDRNSSTQLKYNDNIYEDIFESFVGAFYLNFGYEQCYHLIVGILETEKDFSTLIYYDDNFKDLLLRYFHKMKWGNPIYLKKPNNVRYVTDPDGNILGESSGQTKKIAEQNASKEALKKLNIIINDEIDYDWADKIDIESYESIESNDNDKKIIPIRNVKNKLITCKIIENILKKYNVNTCCSIDNITLYTEGFTHPSYLNRKLSYVFADSNIDNTVPLQEKQYDRLQFIGGAIIHLVIAEFLFEQYPLQNEGFLTRIRSRIDNKEILYLLARACGIHKYALLSTRVELIGGRKNTNIIVCCLSGFVGAMYLDIGYHTTKNFIVSLIKTELPIDEIVETETNYKELLISLYYKNNWGTPTYEIIKEYGPDHSKQFMMCIRDCKQNIIAEASGNSKKKAQKKVAKKAYFRLQNYLNSKK